MRLYRPEREAKYRVRFLLAPGLAYTSRLAFVASCLVLGLAVQVLVSPWVGWGVLLVGAFLAITRGVRNKPSLQGERRWEPVTLDEFQEVLKKAEESRHWVRSVFNLACGRGFLGLLAALYVVLTVAAVFGEDGGLHPLGPFHLLAQVVDKGLTLAQKLWLLDAAALALPIWLSGRLTTWAPDELLLKVKCLLEAAQYIQGHRHAGGAIQPQMEVTTCPQGGAPTPEKKRGLPEAEPQRRLPHDVRLQVHFNNAPEEFLGVQVQLTINRVGADYPYLYCVLLARQGFGLQSRLGGVTEVGREVVEYKVEKDVEVAVCRQFTTRETGYHTDYSDRIRVLTSSLALAHKALGSGHVAQVASGTSPDAAPVSSRAPGRSVGRAPRRH
jgi:hypothetical protein